MSLFGKAPTKLLASLPDLIAVISLAATAQGYAVACRASTENKILIFTTSGRKALSVIPAEDVRCLAFFPAAEAADGAFPLLAAGWRDGRIRLWDVATGSEQAPVPKWRHPDIVDLAVSPDGKHIAVACGDATNDPGVYVIDVGAGAEHNRIGVKARCVAFSPAGDRISFSTDEGLVETETLVRWGDRRVQNTDGSGLVGYLPDGERVWWSRGALWPRREIEIEDAKALALVPGSWTLLAVHDDIVHRIDLRAGRLSLKRRERLTGKASAKAVRIALHASLAIGAALGVLLFGPWWLLPAIAVASSLAWLALRFRSVPANPGRDSAAPAAPPSAQELHERLKRDAHAVLAILTKHLPDIDAIDARVKLAASDADLKWIKDDAVQASVGVTREESLPGGFRVALYPAITLYVRAGSKCRLVVAAGGALPGYEPFHRSMGEVVQLRAFADYPAVLAELSRLEALPPPGEDAQAGELASARAVRPVMGSYQADNYSLKLWESGEARGFRYSWGASGALGSESTCYEGTWTLVPPNVLKLRVLKRESDIEVGFHDRGSSKETADFVKEAVVLDGGGVVAVDGRLLF